MTRGSAFVDSLIGQRIAGRYVIDKMLGTGGMGVVAGGKYPELGQRVAIKFLRPEHADDTTVRDRFIREGRVAAKVKSAHFVRVFDVGTHDSGVPYLVMEMLSGRDLADELRARGPLPIEDAVDVILQACTGVAELHALGVVHRDLKPSNLFVTEGSGKTIKVLDFGISKERRVDGKNPLTSTDNVLGTPQYMSPEQIKASKDVDERSDVWALGVILYELLTQRLPFVAEGPGVGELFARILYFEPEKPTTHRADLPPELESVIMKCLARDLAERWADVGELAEALRPFAAARSLHRIDAVKETLVATPHHVDESMPPPSSPAAKEVSLAPTVSVGGAKAPSTTSRTPEGIEPESIHASSVAIGVPKRRNATRTFIVVAGAALVVGSVAFAIARAKDDVPAHRGAAIVSQPSSMPTPVERETATVPPPAAATASATATTATASAATPIATVAPTSTARPRSTSTARPTATAKTATKPPPSDPILDRK